MKYAILFQIMLVSLSLAGWDRNYGTLERSDIGYSVSSGNNCYYVEGNLTIDTSTCTHFVAKFNIDGDLLWSSRLYGDHINGRFGSIVYNNSTNRFVTTFTSDNRSGSSQTRFYVLECDSSGGFIWEKYCGLDSINYAKGINHSSDGGFVVCGQGLLYNLWPSSISNVSKAYVAKLSEDGGLIWQNGYGERSDTCGYVVFNIKSVTNDEFGGYICAGYCWDWPERNIDVYVLRIREDGSLLWDRLYGTPLYPDWGWDICETPEGDFIVTGQTRSYGPAIGDLYDLYLFKINPTGDVIWERNYGGFYDEEGRVILPTRDGNFMVAGVTMSFGEGNSDGWLLKINTDGDTLWTKTYGGRGIDYFMDMDTTCDGGFIITGDKVVDGTDLWLLKVDSLGEVDWVQEVNSKPQQISIDCYPNPFNSSCAITIPDGAEIEIYDLRGNVICHPPVSGKAGAIPINKGDSEIVAPLSRGIVWTPDASISSGVYLVKATMKNGATTTKRIVYLR